MSPAETTQDRPRRVMLAAGGTGGHIYPAIALAQALAEAAPDVQVQFCCGARPAELQIYRRLGLRPWIMPVSHHRRGARERLRFFAQMVASWRKARRLLRANPVDVAVGFGSYVSVMPLLAARAAGARLVLHEQNVHAGAANRLLAPFAKRIATAEPMKGRGFPAARTRVVGNPVRSEMFTPHDREAARRYFRLGSDRLVCLCIGGSQGAVGLNKILLEVIARLAEADGPAGRWQLLWATGTGHFKAMSEAVARIGGDPDEHALTPFIEHMGEAYAAADLVLARSGALTLAELTALGKPSVLVPLPTSKAGHQEKNARSLAETGAAEVLLQSDPKAAEKMFGWLESWAQDPTKLAEMAHSARAAGRPEAAGELAGVVLELLEQGR